MIEASLGEVYLDPSDQLVESQGKTVCKHVLGKQASVFSQQTTAKGDAKSLFALQAPKSVAEYMKEHQSQQQLELSKHEAAEQQLAAHEPVDELDELLEDLSAGDEPVARMNRRKPGMTSSNLITPASKPAAKAKQGTKAKGTNPAPSCESASAAPSMTSSGAGTAPAALKDDDESSRGGGKAVLDPEMAMVANKHMGSEKGSSVKALQGLVPATFLVMAEKRYTTNAKLRGVCFSVAVHKC